LALLNNRAACHLALKNYGSALRDVGMVIAIGTQESIEIPRKALFRAGQALVALERWDEARDVVERGMEGADEKAWKRLQQDVEKGARRVIERKERLRREKEGAVALKEAIQVGSTMIDLTTSREV
jgi:small subunit ribosomal protein S7e